MEQWQVTLYIDILTLSLPAAYSTILAQMRRDFSLTKYFRIILTATSPVCRNPSKYTPGVGASGARLTLQRGGI